MKKIFLILLAVISFTGASAQKVNSKDIPEAVKMAFQKQFSKAEDIEWEKEDNLFEVEFELSEVEQSAVFDDLGNLLEIEFEIAVNQLPEGVSEFVQKNYSGQKIKEAAKVIDQNQVTTYEAEIKGMDLIFDANGKFIKEIKD